MHLLLCTLALAAIPLYPDDAPLHAVQLIDAHEGWACGSDGVVLHTLDGGKTWEPQESHSRACLTAMQFLTPYTGFVAGRVDRPEGLDSQGVILRTTDGGLTWREMTPPGVAGLHAIHFRDDKIGRVAGDATDACPSGVWTTRDGGATWQPASGPRAPGWRASAMLGDRWLLGGLWNRLGSLNGNQVQPADIDTLGGRNVLGMAANGNEAIAAGTRGLVLLGDAAGRWGYANLGQPPDVVNICDFRGVAMVGAERWVVGQPGTVVWHSANAGQTWDLRPTRQNAGLRAVQFRDAAHGVAVGELGTILLTHDGGRSWQPVRRGGQRAAMLVIAGRPENVPFELLAWQGRGDGYLCQTLATTMDDPATGSSVRARLTDSLLSACRFGGGCGSESLAFAPPAEHAARLAARIRAWQPELIVIGYGDGVDVLARQAIALAAGADALVGAGQVLQLPPWTAKAVAGTGRSKLQASVNDRLAGHSETIGTIADEAGARVGAPAQSESGLALLRDDGVRSLWSGLPLAPGGTARRALKVVALDPKAEEQAKQTRITQQLLSPDAAPLASLSAQHATFVERLAKLPSDRAAQAGWQMVQQHARTGQYPLAAELAQFVAEHYGAEADAALAYQWLVRYSCSSELRRRQELSQSLTTTSVDVTPAKAGEATRISTGHKDKSERPLSRTVFEEERTQLFTDAPSVKKWYERGIALAPLGDRLGPVANVPAARLCVASARRQIGEWEPAQAWYRAYMQETHNFAPGEPWRQAVAAELWLAQRNGPCPKKSAICVRTEKRPHLDGDLADDCWAAASPHGLVDAIGTTVQAYPTQVRWAFDPDFLYIALRAGHPPGHDKPLLKRRDRDGWSEGLDHIEIMLDLDRDYQTYYRFGLDQRGGLHDDCWGDASWNPQWFVASRSTPEGYTAEIAIPRGELTGDALLPGRAWAVNVTRVIPGQGVQVWSPPGDGTVRPEAMGLLLFTAEAKRP